MSPASGIMLSSRMALAGCLLPRATAVAADQCFVADDSNSACCVSFLNFLDNLCSDFGSCGYDFVTISLFMFFLEREHTH